MHSLNEIQLRADPVEGWWYAVHIPSGARARATAQCPPEQHPVHRVRSVDVATAIGYMLFSVITADGIATKGGGFKA